MADTLYCRSLALGRLDFDAIAQAARRFGRPTSGFQQTQSVVSWSEPVSFEQTGWSWASGIPSTRIDTRISVLELIQVHRNLTIFGVISPFASLSAAGVNYISRAFVDNKRDVRIDFGGAVRNDNIQSFIKGYCYEADGILHDIVGSPNQLFTLSLVQIPDYSAAIRSMRIKPSTAVVEINEDLHLSITAEPGAPEYAIEDAQQTFRILEAHING